MDYKVKCDCCGQQLTAYTHNLNQPLVGALRRLVDWYEVKKDICNISQELRLTHNQLANFQKLRHFGVVELVKKGGYAPTKLGVDFIYGREQVQAVVASMGNKTLSPTHEAWETHNKIPHNVYIHEVDVTMYKKKIEYQAEKSNQGVML